MLLGATGLVGAVILKEALLESSIEIVIAPTRRALPLNHKLQNPVAKDLFDFSPHDDWWKVDAVICALGTTRKASRSDAAFQRVDRDLPLRFAQRTRAYGANAFVVISSIGANSRSSFLYTRTKGELEEELRLLRFPSLTILRSSLILGEHKEKRPGASVAAIALQTFAFALPRIWKPIAANALASVALNAVLNPLPGVNILRSTDMQTKV